MKAADLLPGDSIKNIKPYQGEGEKVVIDASPKDFPGHAKVFFACCEKYPELNGHVTYITHESIEQYYKKA